MRLHHLRVTAFGPFADTVEVDFDALSDAGLFLLSGATGAGKSSVLDAVCFALYGDVPGDRSVAKRLRCDQAPADRAPLVELELTLGGRRFRLVRSPAWERPKKRGHGTTTEQARVTISERADGGWVPLSTRLDETGHLLTGLVGMNQSQFTQVALLPQGRFQTFLRARSEDRHKLLQQLFRTGRFEHVERWLRDHRLRLRREHDAAHARVAEVVSRLSEAAGVGLPDGWEAADLTAPLGDDLVVPWAAGLRDRAVAARATARELADAAAQAEAAARAALDGARRRHEQARRLAAARAEHRRLLDHAQQHDDDVRRLELAERTVDVAARHRVAVAAARSAERAAGAHARARAELPADVDVALEQVRSRCVEAERASALLPAVRERVGLLRGRLDAAAEVERLAEAAAVARQEWQVAHAAVLARKEQLLDVREARLAGIAAELAGQLAVGACCPVCGSDAHPQKAAAAPGAPDAEAEKAAQKALDDANLLEQVHDQKVRDLDQRVAAAVARRGEATAAELGAELAGLSEEAEAMTRTAGGLELHRSEVRRLERVARRVRDAEAEAARAERAAEEAGAAVADAAEAAGFATVAEALAASLTEGQRTDLALRVRRHRERLAAVTAVLAEAVDDGPLPDLPPLEQAHARSQAALTTARTGAGVAERRAERLDALVGELRGAVAAWLPLHDDLAVATRVAALADGTSPDNQWRMRLSAYVLSYRLTQVVAAANQRLAPMSDRRYRLEHTGRRGAGETRGGLSLLVHDEWSGESRDPATLSGGETFVVSLALALGLADVITQESDAAGGAHLETLFVDEGFGSLDPDTLDDVMDVLDSLREGGRVVGVVSHVAEMRDRIPTQLVVTKSPQGSSVSLRGA